MISHQYKCIFIHIPRTAGTSIEKWITGADQWLLDPREKHLTALEAKEYYSTYWHKYWKFSIIRQPRDRFLSMLKYSDYFGVRVDNGNLDISSYVSRFGKEITIEHDHRFTDRSKLINMCKASRYAYQPGSIYGNMLGNEMDEIFPFDELKTSVEIIANKLCLDPASFPLTEKRHPKLQSLRISDHTQSLIAAMHSMDCHRFGLRVY
jgi:hypothetical protein